MDEYINRDKLLDALQLFAPEHLTPLINNLIVGLPAADVAPVRRGEWIDTSAINGYGRHISICSACDNKNDYISNYCPNCGADMRKKGADPHE